jgi:hypothetical protein
MLGFREADEMDIHIALAAIRTSWIVIVVALLIWSLYNFFTKGLLTAPFILLSIGLTIYFATILYMREKLSNANQV